MEKLMELVEAEDVDYIYEVFSPAVRENTEGLYEQIQEFIRFVEENVTAQNLTAAEQHTKEQRKNHSTSPLKLCHKFFKIITPVKPGAG